MNEAGTRAEHIAPALKAAGWGVVEGSRIRREYPIAPGRIEGHGKRGKALTADYVLEYRNTKLAVVEAKAWDEELTEGVGQAKNYAGKLAIRHTYSTNGQGIYGIDMETGKERDDITRYPTPDELWKMTFAKADAWRDRFAAVPFEDKGGSHPSRYYQDIAIERAMQAIADDKKRILLTLATGTGKTFIAFQIAWKLFHSRWNLSREPTRRPRILFEDRKSRRQAAAVLQPEGCFSPAVLFLREHKGPNRLLTKWGCGGKYPTCKRAWSKPTPKTACPSVAQKRASNTW